MTITAKITVQSSSSSIEIAFESGSSIVFLGANGSGKTRLGVFIDRTLSQNRIDVHRIAAHRSLKLNPNVLQSNFEAATKRLLYGTDHGDGHNQKLGNRWQGNPETALLSDFDNLLSVLYAENSEVSIAYRESQKASCNSGTPPVTKLDRLKKVWESVLPHWVIPPNSI